MRHDFGDGTDGVWEVFLGWKYWEKGALGKIAVADFPTTWRTDAASFTNGVARCIIVVHVAAFTIGDFHSVDNLSI